MLKGIPKVLSPELLKVLCEMGHSDRLVIGDGNFPSESVGKDSIVIRMDGHGVCEILEAILQLFPLDTYVEQPVKLMQVLPGDPVETPIWDSYKEIVSKVDARGDSAIGQIERFGSTVGLCCHCDRRKRFICEYYVAKRSCHLKIKYIIQKERKNYGSKNVDEGSYLARKQYCGNEGF